MKIKWAVLAILWSIGSPFLCCPEPNAFSFGEPMKMEEGAVKIANTVFQVEFARTPEEKRYGLMFRPDIPPNTGMIFLNEVATPMGVWMKNTYIALDVLFFDENKKIIEIFENLKPLDETSYRPAGFALGMVELPAGTVQKYKIKVGDEIIF